MLALAALPLLKHMTPFWHARGYAYACGEAVCSRVSCKINIVGGVSLFARAPRVMAGPLSPRRAADAFLCSIEKLYHSRLITKLMQDRMPLPPKCDKDRSPNFLIWHSIITAWSSLARADDATALGLGLPCHSYFENCRTFPAILK